MTERGPHVADAVACPFVAFEDEREERSSRPDHRHRCYADLRPAPRALAHQDAYCLSPAFATCPTFQDWARREAARARTPAPSVRGRTDDAGPEIRAAPRRPHDWASPPPWATDAGVDPLPVTPGAELWATATLSAAAGWEHDALDDGVPEDDEPSGGSADADGGDAGDSRTGTHDPRGDAPDRGTGARAGASGTPPFLAPRAWPVDRPNGRPGEGAGLAESAALAAAGGAVPVDEETGDAAPPLRHVAPIPGGRSVGAPVGKGRTGGRGPRPGDRERGPLMRGGVPAGRRGRTAALSDDEPAHSLHGPDWERPQRFEAYPTLRTRVGLPNVPTVALGFGALVVAALALFFIPPLLLKPGGAGDAGVGASPTPLVSAGPSAATSPTPIPSPTPEIYTIKAGDTLSTVAVRYKISLASLVAANPSIKNPDKVAIGDQIVIPTPGSTDVLDAGGSASPSPSGP